MPSSVRLKLSVMMFLASFIWGASYLAHGHLARERSGFSGESESD